MNLEEAGTKDTYSFESSEKAREAIKTASESLGYRFQEMNSIAAAYKGPREAIIKNGEKLEAYTDEASTELEGMIEEGF